MYVYRTVRAVYEVCTGFELEFVKCYSLTFRVEFDGLAGTYNEFVLLHGPLVEFGEAAELPAKRQLCCHPRRARARKNAPGRHETGTESNCYYKTDRHPLFWPCPNCGASLRTLDNDCHFVHPGLILVFNSYVGALLQTCASFRLH